MMVKLSRRKIAAYAADEILRTGSAKEVIYQIAAYLIDSRRVREFELIVRDIEAALADRSFVIAEVTTARPLSEAARTAVAELISADRLQLRSIIDETVLGGVMIDLPGKRFDGTIRHKLNALKAKQL